MWKTAEKRFRMGKSQRKGLLSGRVGALAILGFIAFSTYLLFGKPLDSLFASEEPVLYEIPKNANVSALAWDLHAKGIIAFPRIFKLFIRLTGQERRIRAGFFYLPSRTSVFHMAFTLTSGTMATHTVTITEGRASWEIFGTLKHDFPLLDSSVFDSLVRDTDFAHSLGVKGSSGVEGYLFPDTYILPWRITEQDALRCMVEKFQEVAAKLPQKSQILEKYGQHGWVTLASIVQKEAAVNSEQRLIAGVFQNRLRLGWSLGADPTTRFALRKLTGPLSGQDLDVNSPYNTRKFNGLPPGPVCNPGKDALLAALNPLKTDRMFFVAKDDGSREHYFSATNDEHNAFKLLAAENRLHHEQELDSLAQAMADKTDVSEPPQKLPVESIRQAN